MLTRREILKRGLISSSLLLPLKRDHAYAQRYDSSNQPSPPTTPFRGSLPIPPQPQPVAPFSPRDCPDLVTSQARFYNLVEEERFVQFHPELPPTPIWGYRDLNQQAYPFVAGPTFMERMNQPVFVRVFNVLPPNHRGFGVPRTTVHHHGGHQPFRSDGYPTFDFGPGEFYDYCYPMLDTGFSHGAPDPGDRPSVNWYHDHLADFTGANVYRGLAGCYLVFDELDTGSETTGLKLPSGPFDIPLMIQDKRFNADGTLFFDPFDHDGFIGDKFVVNGAIQPFLQVKRRKYRFRILNCSNARIYRLFLTKANGQTFPFDQIATGGGLLSRPIRGLRNFEFSPAERVEVVVDFRQFQTGDEVYFENRLRQDNGRKPDGLLNQGVGLLKFIVGETVIDPSQVPEVLRPFTPISQAEQNAARKLTLEFERRHGAWVINGKLFDPNRPLFTARANTPQIYRLVNKSGGWWHPIHIHLDTMRVLRRNGKLPPLGERDGIARKDTVLLRDNDEVEIFMKFRDYRGQYVLHCHNLEHEDMAMMVRFDVV